MVARERASEGEAGGGHPISEVLGCRLELLKVTLVRGLLAQARTWTYRTLPSAKHHQHLPLKGASSARRFERIRSTTFSAATCVLERPAPRAACLRPYACSCSNASGETACCLSLPELGAESGNTGLERWRRIDRPTERPPAPGALICAADSYAQAPRAKRPISPRR